MPDNNEEAQAGNLFADKWVELIKTPSVHFSHASSSVIIEKEMEYLGAYEEEAVCC